MPNQNYRCTRGYTLDLEMDLAESVAYRMRVTAVNAVGEGTTNRVELPITNVYGRGFVAAGETGKLVLGSHQFQIVRSGTLGPETVCGGTITVSA